MAPPVLLLSGWSGSGKDAVGTILTKKYGYKRLAFADYLKELVASEYSIPLEWTYTEEGKGKIVRDGLRVRDILIKRGQEIRKENTNEAFFAEKVAKQIIDEHTYVEGFVITDWRLPIEYYTIEKACNMIGIKVYKVRVKRNGQFTSPVNDQLTETSLDRWVFDTYIYNSGDSIANLQKEIDKRLFEMLPDDRSDGE